MRPKSLNLLKKSMLPEYPPAGNVTLTIDNTEPLAYTKVLKIDIPLRFGQSENVNEPIFDSSVMVSPLDCKFGKPTNDNAKLVEAGTTYFVIGTPDGMFIEANALEPARSISSIIVQPERSIDGKAVQFLAINLINRGIFEPIDSSPVNEGFVNDEPVAPKVNSCKYGKSPKFSWSKSQSATFNFVI